MKRLVFIAGITALFTSCETLEKSQATDCPPRMCTEEFRAVSVKFIDSNGSPVKVKNYTSINKRTNASMLKGYVPDTVTSEGIALVASDANLADISEAGDSVIVTGKHPVSNKTVRGSFFITGGKCSCHISKVSGPSELAFN
ncbi:hypothetical protein [Desertivirga brevis]|uniref:hypothetical protein n=1 Tax=Desertivirga brevis TaxID=2810310 RepID=UPI001A978A0C|nr:hypothetical protein [Pedobacter sp. SYSU D00873]